MSTDRDNVSLHIESMFKEVSRSASYHSKINKVYDELRRINERAYDPVLVAIGPIHHNKDHLKHMEQIKVCYLHHFLQLTDETVDRYVVKLRELEGIARNCYSNSIQLPETDKFVEMLLLDGFFMITVLRMSKFVEWRIENDYNLHSHHTRTRIIVDLLLVENQLQFFILRELFEMTNSGHPDDNFTSLILQQVKLVLPWKPNIFSDQIYHQTDDHLLGMVHGVYFPSRACDGRANMDRPSYERINRASHLEEAGIQFEKLNYGTLMDVSFTNGVMRLPCLPINDDIVAFLRNLIAHEQMMCHNERPVSDYSDLMWYLVNSSKDVEILRRAGVLENWLGDDDEVHQMFMQLGKQTGFDVAKFSYLEVYDSVNKHCSQRRNKWMANLRRNYFNSPRSILSVIAAIILLLLTTTQTVFSIIPYVS